MRRMVLPMVIINVLKTKVCPHCSRATEIAMKVAKKMGGVSVKETFLDTPEGNVVAMRHHVMSVPAIMINEKLRFVGMPTEENLTKAVMTEMK